MKSPSLTSFAALLAVAACGPAAPPPTSAHDAHYPAVLHPPSELTPDFSVRQHIAASAQGRDGAFDAVLQKQAGKLLVVGLGPANVRMFVLEQSDDGVRFEQSFGPKLPFPPRNILVDIHRAFYKGLPAEQTGDDGTFQGALDDEQVEEIWRGGELTRRSFSRDDRQGRVEIEFDAGCRRARCAPSGLKIVNPWFDYRLAITNSDFQFFDAPPAEDNP